jgi:hypothetical protein
MTLSSLVIPLYYRKNLKCSILIRCFSAFVPSAGATLSRYYATQKIWDASPRIERYLTYISFVYWWRIKRWSPSSPRRSSKKCTRREWDVPVVISQAHISQHTWKEQSHHKRLLELVLCVWVFVHYRSILMTEVPIPQWTVWFGMNQSALWFLHTKTKGNDKRRHLERESDSRTLLVSFVLFYKGRGKIHEYALYTNYFHYCWFCERMCCSGMVWW